MINLQPLGKRVVVKLIKAEDTTESGIFLPSASKETTYRGEVIAVGTEVDLGIKPGDIIVYSKYYSGWEAMDRELNKLTLIKSDYILAKLTPDDEEE